MEVKRFVFKCLESNMYIMIEKNEAIVIDPHYSPEADKFLETVGVRKITVFITHEHFDHTSGIPWLKEKYNAFLICSEKAMDKRSQERNNAPKVTYMKMLDDGKPEEAEKVMEEFPPYFYVADEVFTDDYKTVWQGHQINVESLPGHSPASCMIMVDDDVCFSGDSIIPDMPIILRWPGSNKSDFYDISLPKINKLPKNIIIYPGHGNSVKFANLKFENRTFRCVK